MTVPAAIIFGSKVTWSCAGRDTVRLVSRSTSADRESESRYSSTESLRASYPLNTTPGCTSSLGSDTVNWPERRHSAEVTLISRVTPSAN